MNESIRTPQSRTGEMVRKVGLYAGIAAGALSPEHALAENLSLAHAEQTSETKEVKYERTAHLSELRDQGKFGTENQWAITANAEAFEKVANEFFTHPETHELFAHQDLHFLYPASGVHLSPLETGRLLAEKSETVKDVYFTYTEIGEESYDKIDEAVQMYVKSNPEFSRLQMAINDYDGKTDSDLPRSKRFLFELKTLSGRTVNMHLDFEYKMSGENWFRKDSINTADVIILHDTDSNQLWSKTKSDIGVLLSNIPTHREEGKKLFAILDNDDEYAMAEGELESDKHINDGVYDLVGKTLFDMKGLHYGCGENHFNKHSGVPKYTTEKERYEHENSFLKVQTFGRVVEVNTPMLTEIKNIGGEHAFEAYLQIAKLSFQFDDLFDPVEILHKVHYGALRKVYHETKNDDLKKVLEQLVDRQLTGWKFTPVEMRVKIPEYKIFLAIQAITDSKIQPEIRPEEKR